MREGVKRSNNGKSELKRSEKKEIVT